ncbi:uncharacterized protein LOC122378950 [Amphibalanus amphitrite]|uniref:uncharacterized protein LOC122378950 n=1 Tax=Amphibalanus amphitrite TaxID=1232801 RepID=UPI001C8FCB61|nr:uncharacterized protein LOC122378950 [Amphibalanus amphitrite]
MSLAVKEKKANEKLESTNRRRTEAEAKVRLELDRSVVLSDSSSAGSSGDSIASAGNSPTRPLRRTLEGNVSDDGNNERPSTSAHTPKRMRASRRNTVLSSELGAALDRTKLSNRNAVHLLSAAARNFGHDPAELVLNRESFRRARMRFREEASKEIKAAFNPDVVLIVHWDGKIVPESDGGGGSVDRLPVLVSGGGVAKLLAVPKLPSGRAQDCAQAVFTALEDWGLEKRVRGLCFDTTAVNSGLVNGACTLIEQKLDRPVLHLACRHHVYELILEKAFSTCLSISSGPDIQLFKRFQGRWRLIDRTTPEPFTADDVPERDELLVSFRRFLDHAQPRDDYRELLELCVIALGGVPKRGVRFSRPGALHRARWMAKGIYAVKTFLFREQFRLTAAEARGIRRCALFVVRTYAAACFRTPFAAAAPALDLAFMNALHANPDKELSKATVPVFGRHLWYLSERLVALALFDPDLPLGVKRDMVRAMDLQEEEEEDEDPPRKSTVDINSATLATKTVASFVTPSSKQLFKILDLETGFFKQDPAHWEEDSSYQAAARVVRELQVVNDFAERGVALMQAYNLALTKDEDQRQFLLQVVEDHRKRYPDACKSTATARQAT